MQIFTFRTVCGHDLLSCKISSQSDERLPRYCKFSISKMAAVRHLGFFCTHARDHQQSGIIAGLYHCAKFGLNRLSSFDNIEVKIFLEFSWKLPIHAPFLGGGIFTPNNVINCSNPQKDRPCLDTRRLIHSP